MSSYAFNITTTELVIPVKGLVNSKAVVIQNNDPDNNVFYNPNPNGLSVLTGETAVVVTGVTGNVYASTSTVMAVGDKLLITTVGGVTYAEEVSAINAGVSFTIIPSSGHTPAATDTVKAPCHKLMDGTTIKSASFPNGLRLKHKDNVSTTEYQVSIVEADTLAPVSPFFFKG